jgi:hypothetical protein
MASPDTLHRRACAAVDMSRTVRPFFTQPAGYLNRHERRALAARKRRGRRPAVARVDDTKLPPLAADAGHIESKAPT